MTTGDNTLTTLPHPQVCMVIPPEYRGEWKDKEGDFYAGEEITIDNSGEYGVWFGSLGESYYNPSSKRVQLVDKNSQDVHNAFMFNIDPNKLTVQRESDSKVWILDRVF